MCTSPPSETAVGDSILVVAYNEAVDGITRLAVVEVPMRIDTWFESQAYVAPVEEADTVTEGSATTDASFYLVFLVVVGPPDVTVLQRNQGDDDPPSPVHNNPLYSAIALKQCHNGSIYPARQLTRDTERIGHKQDRRPIPVMS
ncbi:hypothetical protein QFC20_006299 [Naganishia adeliensis]|uniref:Uncharacterized protein n=1 Tax=Naganishia adeliensis TaxID=92952 RepID=A0ACC2VCM5_9TREE|nr:hypothetical protein QFC20_006299 [Naganishia adeliensis]